MPGCLSLYDGESGSWFVMDRCDNPRHLLFVPCHWQALTVSHHNLIPET